MQRGDTAREHGIQTNNWRHGSTMNTLEFEIQTQRVCSEEFDCELQRFRSDTVIWQRLTANLSTGIIAWRTFSVERVCVHWYITGNLMKRNYRHIWKDDIVRRILSGMLGMFRWTHGKLWWICIYGHLIEWSEWIAVLFVAECFFVWLCSMIRNVNICMMDCVCPPRKTLCTLYVQGSILHSESECPKCPLPTPCSQNVRWFVNVGHYLVFHASVNGSSSNRYMPRAPVTQINRYAIDKVISRLQGCKSMIDWSRCW